jgi:hypothetical protein
MFLQSVKETAETKQLLSEQYKTVTQLISQFQLNQEKQSKQAIEMLTNFKSVQTQN